MFLADLARLVNYFPRGNFVAQLAQPPKFATLLIVFTRYARIMLQFIPSGHTHHTRWLPITYLVRALHPPSHQLASAEKDDGTGSASQLAADQNHQAALVMRSCSSDALLLEKRCLLALMTNSCVSIGNTVAQTFQKYSLSHCRPFGYLSGK